MKTLYLLWRLARVLETARGELRAASINVVVESESSASYRAHAEECARLGLSAPARRTGYEVSLWRDRHEATTGTATKRGSTLAEALAAALK